MSGFTNCPNCAKEGLSVPLTKGDNCLVCSLCESTFELNGEDE